MSTLFIEACNGHVVAYWILGIEGKSSPCKGFYLALLACFGQASLDSKDWQWPPSLSMKMDIFICCH